MWWREARAAGAYPPTGHHGDDLTDLAETQTTTFMTSMLCVIIMETCMGGITQVTPSRNFCASIYYILDWWIWYFISCFLLLTAYCKNSIDGQWYCFDDSEVQPIADEDVCQQTAYILFYQRRTTIPSWSANSSVAGDSCSLLSFGLTQFADSFVFIVKMLACEPSDPLFPAQWNCFILLWHSLMSL